MQEPGVCCQAQNTNHQSLCRPSRPLNSLLSTNISQPNKNNMASSSANDDSSTSSSSATDSPTPSDISDLLNPDLTPEYWLKLMQQHGIEFTLGRIIGPHPEPANRAFIAADLLDMVVEINECASEAVYRIISDFLSLEILSNPLINQRIESEPAKLVRLSTSPVSTFLFTMPETTSSYPSEYEGDALSEPFVMTCGDLLQMFERFGAGTTIEKLIEQTTTLDARALAGKELLAIAREIAGLCDESITFIIERFMDGEGLWDELDDEHMCKTGEYREEVITPTIERYRASEVQKANKRSIIRQVWGDDWESGLDPGARWLHHPSLEFMDQLAWMARSGGRMDIIRAILENAG